MFVANLVELGAEIYEGLLVEQVVVLVVLALDLLGVEAAEHVLDHEPLVEHLAADLQVLLAFPRDAVDRSVAVD